MRTIAMLLLFAATAAAQPPAGRLENRPLAPLADALRDLQKTLVAGLCLMAWSPVAAPQPFIQSFSVDVKELDLVSHQVVR